MQKLHLKTLFQVDYGCILNLSSNSAGKIVIMVYRHAFLVLSLFDLIAPSPIHEAPKVIYTGKNPHNPSFADFYYPSHTL